MMWATAQALVTLPVSLAGYLAACAWLHGQQAGFPCPSARVLRCLLR